MTIRSKSLGWSGMGSFLLYQILSVQSRGWLTNLLLYRQHWVLLLFTKRLADKLFPVFTEVRMFRQFDRPDFWVQAIMAGQELRNQFDSGIKLFDGTSEL